ncbi:hypothetical protein [Mariniflexile sp. AS56]|uniref:hypothetical protein n=1 Tax=Mariniflexile sp. AS56 TaxID=3063957 RepID=UPI0026EE12A3|nr:hypothetical protein [Mariniflexile sp. AS56]MDO7173583.1 hypothetical protein [Mariniflexile sp. AS56]
MPALFKVELIKFSTITELPNAWNPEHYKALLELMDYDTINDIPLAELKETCLILLSENEPTEAAEIVLKYIFNERLNSGQIENLSNEMQEEKVYEEYADLAFHEELFNATQLLYETYNGKFPHPEAVQFKFKVTASKADDLVVFESHSESALLRLLVKGMPENTLINRLYHEQIESDDFEESKNIIWQLKKEETESNSITYTIISSAYWFKDLKYTEGFEASTHSDAD